MQFSTVFDNTFDKSAAFTSAVASPVAASTIASAHHCFAHRGSHSNQCSCSSATNASLWRSCSFIPPSPEQCPPDNQCFKQHQQPCHNTCSFFGFAPSRVLPAATTELTTTITGVPTRRFIQRRGRGQRLYLLGKESGNSEQKNSHISEEGLCEHVPSDDRDCRGLVDPELLLPGGFFLLGGGGGAAYSS